MKYDIRQQLKCQHYSVIYFSNVCVVCVCCLHPFVYVVQNFAHLFMLVVKSIRFLHFFVKVYM